jgi:competence protein ComEC
MALTLGIFDIQKQRYEVENSNHIRNYVDKGKLAIEGVIIESPDSYPDKNVLVVSAERIFKEDSYLPVSGNIRLVVPADLNFHYGDFIRCHTALKNINSFRNPGGFDFAKYLNRQGIYATGFVANEAGIILLRENSAFYLKSLLESFREYLKQIIYKNAPPVQREIIEAMTIGNQNGIPADVRDNFNKTGTSHILSISGLHISMVATMAFFFMLLLLKSSEYLLLRFNGLKAAAIGAFALVLVYALIAGMGVTVVRSALMALIFLIALISGKQKDLYSALSFAALIILVISPEALFDISFQLSFMAVLSLIYIVPRFQDISLDRLSFLPVWGKSILRYIYLSVIVCISATIGTLPIIVYYFNRVSLITIIANLIAVPLLGTLALAVSMFFVLSAFFSPVVAGFFIKLTSFFVEISVYIINKLASLQWSSVAFTKPSIPEIVIFYLFIFLLLAFIATRKDEGQKKGFLSQHPSLIKSLLICTLIFFATDAAFLAFKDKFSTDLKVTAIDVGQGSSILVRFPGGENMIVDGGGFADSTFDMGKLVLAPYLYHERISKIDIVVITHPHPDHYSGLLYILNNFAVREVWTTGQEADDEKYLELLRSIRQKGIKLINSSAQLAERNFNGSTVNILWPLKILTSKMNGDSFEDLNDTSLVIKIKYGNVSFLITGDISANIEKLLIKSGKDLRSEVLIVPHHGSVHSSSIDFIKKVSCKYAIVSAGKANVFKHPHPITLDRYKTIDAKIMRTDQDGAITLTTNGTYLSAETHVKHR